MVYKFVVKLSEKLLGDTKLDFFTKRMKFMLIFIETDIFLVFFIEVGKLYLEILFKICRVCFMIFFVFNKIGGE